MKQWREQFLHNGIDEIGGTGLFQSCTGSLKMSPCGLIDHLESDRFKITPLHFGVKAYLFALYENYHKGVDQKVL